MAERAQSIASQSRSSLASISFSPFWKRLFFFEFWPFYVLYIPAYFYWFYLALKAKHPTYFTAVNPLMNNSGALKSSKHQYLKKLPQQWIPKTFKCSSLEAPDAVLKRLKENKLDFPVVVKPDCGERGKGVHVIDSEAQFLERIKHSNNSEMLVQSFCSYPNEAGILFYRFPDGKKKGISSITTKAFCSLTGNGTATVGQLLSENERVYHRMEALKIKFADDWDRVLASGEHFLVEPIGSHNLGTAFFERNDLNSTALEAQLIHWSNQLPGFYYGRFDVKFNRWEDLLQGKDFKIIEINGVNAEPTHIYNPGYKLRKAYRDIFFHMDLIYDISVQNRALGYRPKPLFLFLSELIKTATQTAV